MLYNRRLNPDILRRTHEIFWERFKRAHPWRRGNYFTKAEIRAIKKAGFWGMWHFNRPVYESKFRDFLAFCAKRGWFGRYYLNRLGRNQLQAAHELSALINAKHTKEQGAAPNPLLAARLKRLDLMRRRIESLEKGEAPDALKRLEEVRLSRLPEPIRKREELLARLRDKGTAPAPSMHTAPSAPSLPQISSLY